MNATTLARRTAAAVAIGAVACLTFTGTAAADPLSDGIAHLREVAGANKSEKAAVNLLSRSPLVVKPIADGVDVATGFGTFAYASPTIGCGPNLPITLTAASTSSGPAVALADGELRFQASPRYSGVAVGSGLTAVWLNTTTGASGIAPIDGVTEFGTPSLSKVVATGPGQVAATLFGTVNYPDATCIVLPTVGLFTVQPPAAPAPQQ
ncbi:hypothetical protein FK531_21115 [Rhodococcus spelaei]|uniref:Secreted protein n=1 Tax=Rhodococcus spelaei TaxID=2546320 RepID=A0A541AZU8_9NOCA|nr:hypothetical protein [Rhodococcus spelaei]TQF65600.1 hypothetical protein FK531_21115 [Rhodococcus spelaei]